MMTYGAQIIYRVFSKTPSIRLNAMVEGLLKDKTVKTINFGILEITEIENLAWKSEIESHFINFNIYYSRLVDGEEIYKSEPDNKVVLETLKSYLAPMSKNVLFSDYDMQKTGRINIDVFF